MIGGPPAGSHEDLVDALTTPGRTAAALATQRGHLRLIGETASVYPRLVVTGRGAPLAVGRGLVTAVRAAGGDAVAIPSREIVGRAATLLDGRTLLLVLTAGEDQRARAVAAEAVALAARPLVVAVVDDAGADAGSIADVRIDSGAPADAGPPLRGPLATGTVLSAISRMLLWGGSADIDEVLGIAAEAAAAAERAALSLADLPGERLTVLASALAGRGAMLATGRDAGRAAAELAAIAWWTNTGRAAAACDAEDFDDGPREGAGRELGVLLLSPDRAAHAADRDLARALVTAGSPVVFVAPPTAAPPGVEAVVLPEVDPVLDPVLHALVATIVGRRVAADHGRPVGRLARPIA